MAKVTVNENCIGCGACTGVAPDVLEMNDDGLASPIITDDLGDLEASAKEAAECCPVEAIVVE